ncbi:MAG: sigma-70 family RNA polymerase sigma factor [Oryzomonas sp.]|uniref:RNA polymerase sigma factor n=1 Tax=Oryzomonas sp. TaxID=2855186 RepID=UPI0028410974|nr:sigma-70 family RNA polymerase sigma factor [Oryzomonas sp.]MDR3579204.1 sigma-70 family RNA polymerase sigma factor [Oryzomonas sp.]
MLTPAPEKPVLSVEEMNEALSSLSDADLIRLGRIARRYSLGRIDPDDLLQQTFEAALEGNRNCPRGISLIAFLAGTMRSLASSLFKSHTRSPELLLIARTGDDCDETSVDIDKPTEVPNADQMLISEEESAAIRTAILSLFADDEHARLIVEGNMEGMDASELRELTGLDGTAYNSKRRLMRRRIDKAYPEGWKL